METKRITMPQVLRVELALVILIEISKICYLLSNQLNSKSLI